MAKLDEARSKRGGETAAVFGAAALTNLDPLLQASGRHPGVIYAWELINEPDWVTSGWHPLSASTSPVPDAAMRAFIEDGKQWIRAAGYNATIGFASIGTLRKTGITAEINQFHHYPNGAQSLDRHTFDPRFPGIIGEFATAAADVWPDLPMSHPPT